MKVVVLMSRLSDYMLSCLTAWQAISGVELHIVRFKVDNTEAPFQFGDGLSNAVLYERESLPGDAIVRLIEKICPRLIVCFGWFDPAYVAAVKARPNDTVAVMTMDNQWHRSFRQSLGTVWGRLYLQKHFDFVWVPGAPQRRFALKLGFPEVKIREGLYVANDENFAPLYRTIGTSPKKRLVFVGRYIEEKGIHELWDAFAAHHENATSNLELVCVVTGPLFNTRKRHPRITHKGFVQPCEFKKELSGGGIFILPSKFEPWGVVVHEFALAGFPLVVSEAVGAHTAFVHTDNGRVIGKNGAGDIQNAISFVDALDETTLSNMSEASRKHGLSLSVNDWCAQADEFLHA